MAILSSAMRRDSYMTRLQAVKNTPDKKGRSKRQSLCMIHAFILKEMEEGPERAAFAKQTPASWSDERITQVYTTLRPLAKALLAEIKKPTT